MFKASPAQAKVDQILGQRLVASFASDANGYSEPRGGNGTKVQTKFWAEEQADLLQTEHCLNNSK